VRVLAFERELNRKAMTFYSAEAVEGAPRSGPISGAWLSAEAGQYQNWWQLGFSPTSVDRHAIVGACVSAYAQTVAMCPGDHWRSNRRGGRDRVTTSALSRILRSPNSYQTISDFLLNATRSLYLDGNCYALALRTHRFEIDELHLMDAASQLRSSPKPARCSID
jgi:phage portal protein BeeE